MDDSGDNRGSFYGFLFDLSSILLNKIGIKKDPWMRAVLLDSQYSIARV